VKDFGFLRLTTTEKSGAIFYPTPSDYVAPGWLTLDIHASNFGDFNGDGLQDLLIVPMLFNHRLPRTTKIDPLFLIQNQSGGFRDPQTLINSSRFPDIHFQYRIAVTDFNRDGSDDAVASTMGRPLFNGSEKGESPAVIFGSTGQDLFLWDNFHSGLNLFHSGPNGNLGYSYGHSIATGDFNGDDFPDWFSNWYVFINNGAGDFSASVVIPNFDAARGLDPYPSQWMWPLVNASVSADFDEDGFDDLVWSTMPRTPDPLLNGGDLWMARGSSTGLLGGERSIQVPRVSVRDGNTGTNFIVAADFNGDSHVDILLLDHSWTTDSGSSEHYYTQGVLRMFCGDGRGGLVENKNAIIDPLAFHRHGEGNIHVLDVNGDGWKDVVLSGYGQVENDKWTGRVTDQTTILVNSNGILRAVPHEDLAWVNSYQFAGEEGTKPYNSNRVERMSPVDIGDDGMIDFVGFVSTPLHRWPQEEQIFTYGYIVEARKPLGRPVQDEGLSGTRGADWIRGYDGQDTLVGHEGDDTLDGGSGVDTVIYSGLVRNFKVIKTAGGYTVEDTVGSAGTDTLMNVEYVSFDDRVVVVNVNDAPIGSVTTAGGAAQGEATSIISTENLYKVYLSYFGRPPDPTGLAGFASSTEAQVIAAFSASQESRDLLAGTGVATQVNSIYRNLFGRDAETAGLAYWVNEVGSGRVSLAGAAFTIQGAALNEDALTVTAKMEVMQAFVSQLSSNTVLTQGYSGNAAAQVARDFLANVKGASAAEISSNKLAAIAGLSTALNQVAAAGNGSVRVASAEELFPDSDGFADSEIGGVPVELVGLQADDALWAVL
jgi:hypothetical protein